MVAEVVDFPQRMIHCGKRKQAASVRCKRNSRRGTMFLGTTGLQQCLGNIPVERHAAYYPFESMIINIRCHVGSSKEGSP